MERTSETMLIESTPLEYTCQIRMLPQEELVVAADMAMAENPVNAPGYLAFCMEGEELTPPTREELAVMTGKYWGSGGKTITVGFLDNPNAETRRLILQYANRWSEFGNIRFVESQSDPMIRILREPNDGYWSYLGTDILRIPRGQQTMNLAGFTERTSLSEYERVVVHEFGHSCGLPHEHLRKELVALIDAQKAIAFFRQYSGWSEQMTVSNVLTPLEERSIMGSTAADPVSIMCYPLPASIMRDGRPLPGGATLSPVDKSFFAQLYPLAVNPPPPPPPSGTGVVALTVDLDKKRVGVQVPPGWTAAQQI